MRKPVEIKFSSEGYDYSVVYVFRGGGKYPHIQLIQHPDSKKGTNKDYFDNTLNTLSKIVSEETDRIPFNTREGGLFETITLNEDYTDKEICSHKEEMKKYFTVK